MTEIRPLRPEDDRAAVSRVYELSWRRAYRGIIPQDYLDCIPQGHWVPFLETPGPVHLVALDGEQVVGTASVSPARPGGPEGWGELISLYLLPQAQGRGLGRALLEAARDALKTIGYKNIYLWVLEGNAGARGFYEHMGFRASGQYLDDRIGGAPLREMQYRLEAGESESKI